MKDFYRYWRKSSRFFLVDLVLSFFSYVFLCFYWLRIILYKAGIIRKKSLDAWVISVGNLTLGGSGKTPMVLYLASEFEKMGKKVAIFTRGYKKRGKGQKELFGELENLNWELYGDEPFLLALNLSSVPVLINKNRFEAGLFAQKRYKPDVFILDDGFQHWSLKRDVDLVMVDSTYPLSREKLFPLGRLREPLSALKRAELVVLNQKGEDVNSEEDLRVITKNNPSCFVTRSFYEVSGVEDLTKDRLIEFSSLRSKKTVAFSGIADNLSFEKTIRNLGMVVLSHIKFPDHHIYSEKDMWDIQFEAKKKSAEVLCTTEKDRIKIPKNFNFQIPVYAVKIRLSIKEKEKEFWDFMEAKLGWR